MPRNGSGTMTLVHDWTADAAAGIDITASRFDAQHEDIRDELTNSVAKDGQTTMTGNLKVGGNKVTGLAAGTAADDAATLRQAQSGASAYAADTGSANAYALAPTPAYTAYVTGMVVRFKAANANTGASTLNVNGLGVRSLLANDTALTADQIRPNQLVEAVYDGTAFQMSVPKFGTSGYDLVRLDSSGKLPALDGSNLTNVSSSSVLPAGVILMWSGSQATIPSGWVLCDGTNSTPDLRNRFVVGAGDSYAVGATGGADSVTLSTSQIPSHTHSFSATTSSAGNHRHGLNGAAGGSLQTLGTTTASVAGITNNASEIMVETYSGYDIMETTGAHTHSISGTSGSAGSGSSHENRPPYYALCYIMKT